MKDALHRVCTVSRVAAAGLLVPASATALAEGRHGRPCSNASLKGTFGIYRTGTIQFGAGGSRRSGF